MNYRERYLIKAGDRRQAEKWLEAAARRMGLFVYQQANVLTVSRLSLEPGALPRTLSFYFQPLDRDTLYLRRIKFNGAEWLATESAEEAPASLEELTEIKAPAFAEIYEGIYSRLFPFVEHEDVHTDASSEDYE